MTTTLLRVCWISLRRDRVALLLTFVLPIAFFSVFAVVLGGQRNGTSAVDVAVADLDHSEASRRMVAALAREEGLRVRTKRDDDAAATLDREQALALVTGAKVPAAIVLLPGFGERLGAFGAFSAAPKATGVDGAGDGTDSGAAGGALGDPAVELLVDSSDPVAGPMVNGLLQKVAMTAMPDLMAKRGLRLFETFAGAFTPQQSKAIDRIEGLLRARDEAAEAAQTKAESGDARSDEGAHGGDGSTDPPKAKAAPAGSDATFAGPVSVRTVDVLGDTKTSGIMAFYAAGTGVMFLLFSMASAAGTILEEEESGTLERVLTGGLGAGPFLLSKWFFFSLVGIAQVSLMFLWGWWRFRLELFAHLGGFVVITVATAAAAAAFGLVLAGLCRTRAQLGGLSTVVILIMSAIGGSMFPRFMMPAWVQTAGLATFNAWALDGYQKVFWYEQPTWTLWPQLAVLAGLTVAFLTIARVLARRWETV
ncbi:MAG: ABC transporter permease [Phycisphaerales bacterium]